MFKTDHREKATELAEAAERAMNPRNYTPSADDIAQGVALVRLATFHMEMYKALP